MNTVLVWACVSFAVDQEHKLFAVLFFKKSFESYYFLAISSFSYFSSWVYLIEPNNPSFLTYYSVARLLCFIMEKYSEICLLLSDCTLYCLWDASSFRLIAILSHSLDMSFPGERGSSQTYLLAMRIIKRRLENNLISVNHYGFAIGLRQSSYLWMRQIALHLTFPIWIQTESVILAIEVRRWLQSVIGVLSLLTNLVLSMYSYYSVNSVFFQVQRLH